MVVVVFLICAIEVIKLCVSFLMRRHGFECFVPYMDVAG